MNAVWLDARDGGSQEQYFDEALFMTRDESKTG